MLLWAVPRSTRSVPTPPIGTTTARPLIPQEHTFQSSPGIKAVRMGALDSGAAVVESACCGQHPTGKLVMAYRPLIQIRAANIIDMFPMFLYQQQLMTDMFSVDQYRSLNCGRHIRIHPCICW